MDSMDTVDRAVGDPGGQVIIDDEVVKLRRKPEIDEPVSIEAPLRDSIPSKDLGCPSKFRPTSHTSKRNTRRRMEDRHVILHDLKAYLSSGLQDKLDDNEHISLYAVYDGHAGVKAATTAAAHLHEQLAASEHFKMDPAAAIQDAIERTDKIICENPQDQNNGSCLVLNLIKDRTMYCAWLGDSQSVMGRGGSALKLVDPHNPKRDDEKERYRQASKKVK